MKTRSQITLGLAIAATAWASIAAAQGQWTPLAEKFTLQATAGHSWLNEPGGRPVLGFRKEVAIGAQLTYLLTPSRSVHLFGTVERGLDTRLTRSTLGIRAHLWGSK